MLKKFEYTDERENKFLNGYYEVKVQVDKLNDEVDRLSKQENYLIAKQQKYKLYINQLKETANDKIEKLRKYCNDTFSKQNTKFLMDKPTVHEEGNQDTQNQNDGELNAEELFFLDIKKKLKENEKGLKLLTK